MNKLERKKAQNAVFGPHNAQLNFNEAQALLLHRLRELRASIRQRRAQHITRTTPLHVSKK